MQQDHGWASVASELDRWRDAGKTARLWLRDDDAHAPGPALDRLITLLNGYDAPCLLAVVPMLAKNALVSRLAEEPRVRIAVHGARHANHAPGGRKNEETPIERGFAANMAALAAARERLVALFGPQAGAWYVPPWNRIAQATAAGLPGLGFRAISTYRVNCLAVAGLAQLNTHVDIMDWRGGRVGHSGDTAAAELAAELALARNTGFGPVGILTHHLDHDATAWSTLESILAEVARHPSATWCHAEECLG